MAKNDEDRLVYAVMSVDDCSDDPLEADVVGVYESKVDALKACTDYIMERIGLRPDIRYAVYNDVNHGKQLRRELKVESGLSYAKLKRLFKCSISDRWELPRKVHQALWCFLRLSLECDGAYDISTDMESEIGASEYIFDIQKIPFYRRPKNEKGK